MLFFDAASYQLDVVLFAANPLLQITDGGSLVCLSAAVPTEDVIMNNNGSSGSGKGEDHDVVVDRSFCRDGLFAWIVRLNAILMQFGSFPSISIVGY
ncbi:hypothetical protein Nepgr_002801 [Nepenthes gracilis]|uniref:Uncharacterized protein n=1 Tax=Nepenthes gracilis TaxID=150966 RepID=A0AAD3RX95_NEPGR|nr:hypothetical protein Nepgr_002801 [Nepenthes gracilis]